MALLARISFNNAPKARTFSIGLNGGYTFNYIASQRILFLKETYLPQYDYTARKGAQLSTQTNVGGCYKLGGSADFSQQIASLRSTVSATIGYDFQQTPYFLDETLCHSGRHALSFRAGFESGFSSKVKIAVSSVTSMSLRFSSLMAPTPTVKALSDCHPSRINPQSIESTSPSFRMVLSEGMPCTTSSLTEAQMLAG